MMFLGTPALGDPIYTVAEAGKGAGSAGKLPPPPRLCLHAAKLGFKHPTLGKWAHYESPLPKDVAGYAANRGIVV
jgi:23S rRNA-/tRNA-specific pseudouridylate synthase